MVLLGTYLDMSPGSEEKSGKMYIWEYRSTKGIPSHVNRWDWLGKKRDGEEGHRTKQNPNI